MKAFFKPFPLFLIISLCLAVPRLYAQDWVHTGTNMGNSKIRIAAADFKPGSGDPQLRP